MELVKTQKIQVSLQKCLCRRYAAAREMQNSHFGAFAVPPRIYTFLLMVAKKHNGGKMELVKTQKIKTSYQIQTCHPLCRIYAAYMPHI